MAHIYQSQLITRGDIKVFLPPIGMWNEALNYYLLPFKKKEKEKKSNNKTNSFAKAG
jgi:hypothetical protein